MTTIPDEQKKGIVGEISDNLSALFRHLLPGVLIIGAFRIIRPSWFINISLTSWPNIVVIGAIAVTIGNTWFSVNRFIIHQLIDYLCWLIKLKGPAKSDENKN